MKTLSSFSIKLSLKLPLSIICAHALLASSFSVAAPLTTTPASFERARESMVIREYKELYETGLGSMKMARQALERKPRAGFVKRGVKRPETVAQHSINLARAAFSIAPNLNLRGSQLITYVRTALIHDLAEWKAQDYTPGEVSKHLKMKKENAAMDRLERMELEGKDKVDIQVIHEISFIRAIWDQYNDAETAEYKLLKQLNKMDAFVKAAHYIEARNGSRKRLLEFFEWIEESAEITNPKLIEIIRTLKKNMNSSTTPNKQLHKWYFRELSKGSF